jgi:hypothetical protein
LSTIIEVEITLVHTLFNRDFPAIRSYKLVFKVWSRGNEFSITIMFLQFPRTNYGLGVKVREEESEEEEEFHTGIYTVLSHKQKGAREEAI